MSNTTRQTNPYTLLGLQEGTQYSLAQVRAKYFELARNHHPDKLHNISEEEKKYHEELFKEITVAYATIEREKTQGTKNASQDDYYKVNPDDWRSVWNGLESLWQTPGVWDTMKDIVKDTIKEVAVKGLKKLANRHFVKVPVTLEEVHAGKQKKIRLFLNHVPEPVFIVIDLGEYPSLTVSHTLSTGVVISIEIEMSLQEHALYRFDDVMDSWDLYTHISMTWVDFFKGKQHNLPYIDGTYITIDILPFTQYSAPITVQDKGLCGLGDLYVCVDLQYPNVSHENDTWDTVSDKNKDIFLDVLSTLYSTDKT